VRFKTTLTAGSKFQVAGVNTTSVVSEPFFSSFVASTSSFTTDRSDGGSFVTITNTALTEQKRPYFVYDAYLKPENSPNPVNRLTHFNVRASTYEQGNFNPADLRSSGANAAAYTYGGTQHFEDLWQGQAFSQTSWFGSWISNIVNNGYWGSANTAAGGGSIYVSLFEVPRLPPLSIASVHAKLFSGGEPRSDSPTRVSENLLVDGAFNVTLASQGFNNNNLNTWLSGRMDPASPVAMGAPGYLTQADVLTLIGPMLSARSDTFIIRAYGEYGSGGDLSRAWCEITVQRVPDYVDSSRTKGASPSWRPSDRPAAATYDTAPAKRRFVIKDFRWIAPDDV
jgi:hypothetical protein